MTGAALRALLVIAMIATPSVIVGGVGPEGRQMVALVAFFAGALTFVEYSGTYPGLVEFRDAKPFNRIRFGMLAATVILLSLIEAGRLHPAPLAEFLRAVGALVGSAMDFPFSPVRLAVENMAPASTEAEAEPLRTAVGMAWLVTLIALVVFVLRLRAAAWPRGNAAFNVWINLPTFDPSAGGDVVHRLRRDARVNIALGFLFPFWIPLVLGYVLPAERLFSVSSPQALIWTVTAWSFLPASLIMRGIGLIRVAALIAEKRRASAAETEAAFAAA